MIKKVHLKLQAYRKIVFDSLGVAANYFEFNGKPATDSRRMV